MNETIGEADPRALRTVVCVKQVLDPEAPPALLEIDPATCEVTGRGVAPRLDPYSLHALQAALQIRAACEGGRPVDIHVVGVGPAPSRNLYLRALAGGADRVTLLDTASDPIPFADSWATASRLAALIRSVAPDGWDLVLTGRRAADTNAGAVGPTLARLLDCPAVTLATAITLDRELDQAGRHAGDRPRGILVEQLAESGSNTVACGLPAVVSVSHEVGEVPVVPFAKIVEAKRMPLSILGPDDLGVEVPDPSATARPTVTAMTTRDDQRTCEIITGDDARDAGRELALRLSTIFVQR